MAHMKLYKGTVPGIATGTEITGVGSDVIIAEGLYNTSVADGKANDRYNTCGGGTTLLLCLRCDTGYQVTNCTMSTVDTGRLQNGYSKSTFWKPSSNSAGAMVGDGSANMPYLTDYKSYYCFSNGVHDNSSPSCYLPSGAYIRQLNVGFYLVVQCGRSSDGVVESGDLQDTQLNISFVEETYP